MKLTDFLEKVNAQAKQLEMIGFKDDILFTSMQQFVDKLIFKLVPDEMNEEEVNVVKSFHDPKLMKKALNEYRNMVQNGSINASDACQKLVEAIKNK